MVIGFSHVQLAVHDVGVSAAWYGTVLGNERFVEGTIASGPYVALRHPVAGFVIGMHTAGADDGSPRGVGSVDHLSFAVADEASLRTARERLLADGFAVGEVFEEAAPFNVRLRDPDGLVVELTARKRVRD